MRTEQDTVTESGHIALYLPSLRGGGAEKVMLNLAHEFANRGHTVDIILVEAYGAYFDEVSDEINVIDFDSMRFFAALPKLVRYLKRSQPDALLSTIDTANIVSTCAKHIAGVSTRVVIRVSNTISTKEKHGGLKHRFVHRIAKWVYPYADKIVAVSDGVAFDIQAAMDLPAELITTIYNPSVTSELKEKKKERVEHPWFSKSVPVILGVGEFTKQKDFLTLIRAFSIVLQDREARLVLLGKGPQREAIEAEIKQLGLKEFVCLPGFVENPYKYMAKANVFVLSSRWEGCPNVLIEALACGVSVVSTDCPNGPKEILEDGKWGQLIPVEDTKAMAKAIHDTIDNGIIEDSQHYAGIRFSVENITTEYELELLSGSDCNV